MMTSRSKKQLKELIDVFARGDKSRAIRGLKACLENAIEKNNRRLVGLIIKDLNLLEKMK